MMAKEQSIRQKFLHIQNLYRELSQLKAHSKGILRYIEKVESETPTKKMDRTLYDNMCRRITTLEVKLNKLPNNL